MNTIAYATIKAVLGKSNGQITPADAKKIAVPALIKDKTVSVPQRNEVLRLIVSDSWLSANQDAGGFVYSDGTIYSA